MLFKVLKEKGFYWGGYRLTGTDGLIPLIEPEYLLLYDKSSSSATLHDRQMRELLIAKMPFPSSLRTTQVGPMIRIGNLLFLLKEKCKRFEEYWEVPSLAHVGYSGVYYCTSLGIAMKTWGGTKLLTPFQFIGELKVFTTGTAYDLLYFPGHSTLICYCSCTKRTAWVKISMESKEEPPMIWGGVVWFRGELMELESGRSIRIPDEFKGMRVVWGDGDTVFLSKPA